MNNEAENNAEPLKQEQAVTNEVGGIYFSTHLKVTDPNSKEILVQMRGD
jgi:hypothetical protein